MFEVVDDVFAGQRSDLEDAEHLTGPGAGGDAGDLHVGQLDVVRSGRFYPCGRALGDQVAGDGAASLTTWTM